MMIRQLEHVTAGQLIPFGGNQCTEVSAALAANFRSGDHLVVVQESGEVLHIPLPDLLLASSCVEQAQRSFVELARCSDEQISMFFDVFATNLATVQIIDEIVQANMRDVERAQLAGRSTTRLRLSPAMRADMIRGLEVWRDMAMPRDAVEDVVEHPGFSVTTRRAPLGVVGFVFEGRPNVFADATGVLRSGNTAVFRIGRDALGTAQAIMHKAVVPALLAAGLPAGAVGLIESPAHAAGWALFNDQRLSLAVARGSGNAVAQLGAVARQAGVPVSLHGTGGSWLVASAQANLAKLSAAVENSLDRKVCNTLNVCCIQRSGAALLIPRVVAAVSAAGAQRGVAVRLHIVEPGTDSGLFPTDMFERTVSIERADGLRQEPMADIISVEQLGHEWEWETSPELSLVLVDSLAEAIALFNRWSPRLAASLISEDVEEQALFACEVDAPFIGDGMTRWVDGQFALDKPELGLSNWAHGRLFARSAVLSGDSVFSRRLFASVRDPGLHR